MQSVLKENRHLLPMIFGLLCAAIITFSDYSIYFVPVVLVLSFILIFIDRIKEKFHLVIWSFLLLSIFLGGARDQEAVLQQTIDPLRLLRIMVLILLFLIVIFGFFLNKFHGIKEALKSPFGWFLLYGLIAMLSSLYSEQFFVSLWKGFEVFSCITIAIYLYLKLKSYNDLKQFWTLNIVFILLLVGSSYVGMIVAPYEALREVRGGAFIVLEGIYPPINANSLTQMAAIIIIVFFIRYLNSSKNKINLLAIFFTIPVLFLSYGRTSILALFVSLIILLIINKNYRYLFLSGIFLIIMFWIDGYSYVELFFQKGDSLSTLSGRLHYWPSVWELFTASPIYGYGFYVASRVVFAQEVEIESFSTTDNTYFDVILSVGFIGFIPFILTLFCFGKRLIKKFNSFNNKDVLRFRLEILCIAIIIFFRSLTGPSIQILHWNLCLFLAVIICIMGIEKYENSSYS